MRILRKTTTFEAQERVSLRIKNNQEFSLSEGSLFAKRESSVVRSPGFGPGFLPWQGNVLDHSSANATETLTWLDYDRKQTELIVNTLIYLKDKGDLDVTKNDNNDRLNQIRRHADLTNPQAVKEYIDNAKKENGEPLAPASRNKLAFAYESLCKANGMKWTKPIYKVPENIPLIPTKDAVTKIIASCKTDYKTIYTLMAEIGCSPEELHSTPRKKIHTETDTIDIIGHKGHASAPYKLKPTTAEMLKAYLATHPEEYPFPIAHNISHTWIRARDRVANQYKQPEIKQIQLRNLRNYSGATFYNSLPIRDPVALMRHLRHKKLDTTQHYIQAIILDLTDDQWISLVTHSTDEECKAIEKGYQLVRAINETTALYRKRK